MTNFFQIFQFSNLAIFISVKLFSNFPILPPIFHYISPFFQFQHQFFLQIFPIFLFCDLFSINFFNFTTYFPLNFSIFSILIPNFPVNCSIFVKLLALALTNLVLSLVKPSLGQPSHKPDKPSLDLDKTRPGVDTIFRKSTHPPETF